MHVSDALRHRAILFVRDTQVLRQSRLVLERLGVPTECVRSADACLAALSAAEVAVVVVYLDELLVNAEACDTVADPAAPPSLNAAPPSTETNTLASTRPAAGSGLRQSDVVATPSSMSYGVDGEANNARGRRGECVPGGSLDLLRAIRRASPLTRIVALLDRRAQLETCCQAVALGVCGFVDLAEKDAETALQERITQALTRYETARQETRSLQGGAIFDETGLAGQSRRMAQLLLKAKRAAMVSDVPVLIEGESGTGKQLIAEAIHRLDPKRHDRPFLAVNCAAIHDNLAESALFGHTRGAFTGAAAERPGYFRAANGGTILLDEISELDAGLQPKLLRVLQAGRVLPVGADRELPVDTRVIAASNRSLAAAVARGEFRLDLFQRLNVISLSVPPLRERPEDVPALLQFFVQKYASYYPPGIDQVDPRVTEVLAQSIGAGNVRELENTVRRMLVFKPSGHCLELADIPPDILARRHRAAREDEDVPAALASTVSWLIRSGRWTLQQMLDEFEKLALREALTVVPGTQEDVAARLGITRRTLYNKIRSHGIDPPPRRHGDLLS